MVTKAPDQRHPTTPIRGTVRSLSLMLLCSLLSYTEVYAQTPAWSNAAVLVRNGVVPGGTSTSGIDFFAVFPVRNMNVKNFSAIK